MSTPACPHTDTSEVDDRQVCDECGEFLSRDEVRRRSHLEQVAAIRQQLREGRTP
jgi:predicted nucleic acid-binding Zn ribbon protein